jgi:hypothetical protein
LFPDYAPYITFQVTQLLVLYYCFYKKGRQTGMQLAIQSVMKNMKKNKNFFSFVNIIDSSATKGFQSTSKVNQTHIKGEQ